MAQPDYFLPAIFDLTHGNVQGIETSDTPPKTVFDATGLHMVAVDGDTDTQLTMDPVNGANLVGKVTSVWGRSIVGGAVKSFTRMVFDSPLTTYSQIYLNIFQEATGVNMIRRLLDSLGRSTFIQDTDPDNPRLVRDHHFTVSSGWLNPGDTVNIPLEHGLNRTDNWQFMFGNVDNGWGYWVGTTIGVTDANTCYVGFANLGPGGAAATLHITIRTFD